MTALLAGQGQKISILCVDIGHEATTFAGELVSAFKAAGWDVLDQTRNVLLGASGKGLVVTVKSLKAVPVRAIAISNTLAAAALPAALIEEETLGPDDLRLFVGSR